MLRLLASEPNVLLLDEPTNDLDTDTLASLEDLLDTWPGTLIVASHDRYLVERVCDTVYALPGDGSLRHLPGGIDQYLSMVGMTAANVAATDAGGGTVVAKPGGAAERTAPTQAERAARQEFARLERTISRLEQRESALHDELAAHASDYARVTELDAALRQVRAEREAAETQWLELAERIT
jgi:ABC-type sulfate/molybdate transport systems ATPase subunit